MTGTYNHEVGVQSTDLELEVAEILGARECGGGRCWRLRERGGGGHAGDGGRTARASLSTNLASEAVRITSVMVPRGAG